MIQKVFYLVSDAFVFLIPRFKMILMKTGDETLPTTKDSVSSAVWL